MPPQIEGSNDAAERRQYARHQVKSLAYLDIGPDNGGIVLNISESGLAVHAVSVLPPEPVLGLRIQLPKSSKRLETQAKVAWTSGTRKEAGVEFIDLPEDARLEIREWLLLENVVETTFVSEALPPEPAPTRRAARTDKWTNLVGELTSPPPAADPIENGPRSASHPIAFARPAHTESPIAPPPAEMVPNPPTIAASGKSSEGDTNEGIETAESPENNSTEWHAESDANAEWKLESRFSPPDLTETYDPLSRRSGTELSLPSDTLLNTPQHPIAIVPNRSEKSGAANGARNPRDSAAGAPPEDEFLKKARSLFGPRREPRTEPEIAELPAIVEPAPEPEPSNPTEEMLAGAEASAATPADLDATPTQPSEATVLQIPAPGASVFTKPMDPRGGQRKPQLDARTTSRGLDFRSTMGIVALCVVVAVVCVGLGIAVGRRVAKNSSNLSGSATGVSSVPGTAETASNAGATSSEAAGSGGNNRSASRGESTARRQSPHTTPPARPRTSSGAPASSSDAALNETGSAEASQPEAENSAASAPTSAAGSNGVSVTPATALTAPASVTPDARGAAPPPSEAAPRTSPPADRLVPAHLIYRVEPFYPRDAVQQRVEGTVKIHAVVAQDGHVKNLKVVGGPPSLTSAALDAAQYWRYIPALRNGEPVESEEDINIEFHLLH